MSVQRCQNGGRLGAKLGLPSVFWLDLTQSDTYI